MWKALDRIVSAIIRRLFKPKYHVERVERYQLPGRLRIVKWCAAPADAPEDELRRIFSIVDEPQCDDMVVWFYSSLEDAGIDVELSDGTQHFSLMPNDQTNIDSMFAAITLGASEYPYHPDGGKCVMYSAADIITLYSEYKSFVTKQTTYCNALRQWAKRETDPNVIGSIYYGCALPEDLEKEVGDILSAAQAQITAIINKLSA